MLTVVYKILFDPEDFWTHPTLPLTRFAPTTLVFLLVTESNMVSLWGLHPLLSTFRKFFPQDVCLTYCLTSFWSLIKYHFFKDFFPNKH